MPEPRATYRLQLHAGFPFAAAAGLADYLQALGISHAYTSPVLQAAPGSTHGYDVVDPTKASDELGGDAGFEALAAALAAHGLGILLDVVPNHMAAAPQNPWWRDLLARGRGSRYAGFFDVDWRPPEASVDGAVLLPVLSDRYGRVLERGGIRIVRRGAGLCVAAEQQEWPLAEGTPLPAGSGPAAAVGAALARIDDAGLQALNASPPALDAVLQAQHYRLCGWRTATWALGYRRFFDITGLVALNTADRAVFAAVHELPLRWLRDGRIDGLRVDHPDGLADPQQYLQRLRAAVPQAWLLVEKILGDGEPLPADWPVDGTTGYDFMARVGRLFVDPAGEAPLTQLYADFCGEPDPWPAVVQRGKQRVLELLFGGDLARLAPLLLALCRHDRALRDVTRPEATAAVAAFVGAFDVYRSYVQPGSGRVDDRDRARVEAAAAAAEAARPDLPAELFTALRDVLLLRRDGPAAAELAIRLQQLAAAVTAKGVEDTAGYDYLRFAALNEVGSEPGRFAGGVDEFHYACAATAAHWPRSLLATSTHDNKRSEDVRARLYLLSEMPAAWQQAVQRWHALASRHRRDGLPDARAEYLLWQTLVGAWPIDADRAAAYLQKAVREAKRRTSWRHPDAGYEQALDAFVRGVLADRGLCAEIEAFTAPLVEAGQVNSLAMTLLKLAAPGVPDFYQGCELWDFSLVDPDNRRPVDYAERRRLLAFVDGATPEQIWAARASGAPKLWLIRQALALRAQRPQWFRSGHRPLPVRGGKAGHLVAFARGDALVAGVPRLWLGLGGDWQDTVVDLPPGRFRDQLTGDVVDGGSVRVARLTARWPLFLLAREEA